MGYFLFFFLLPNFSQAEAEQMAKKADAWKEYQEAALVDMMLKVMRKAKKVFSILDFSFVRFCPKWRER